MAISEGKMTEEVFYGIWNAKQNYWTHLNRNLGLFVGGPTGLRLALGFFHNIRQKYDDYWEDGMYQVRRLGEDGLPTGKPLND